MLEGGFLGGNCDPTRPWILPQASSSEVPLARPKQKPSNGRSTAGPRNVTRNRRPTCNERFLQNCSCASPCTVLVILNNINSGYCGRSTIVRCKETAGSCRRCTSTGARTLKLLFLIQASTVLVGVGPLPNWRERWRRGCGRPRRRWSRTTGRSGWSASRPSWRCLRPNERRSSQRLMSRRGRGTCSLLQGRTRRPPSRRRRRRLCLRLLLGRSGRCRTASRPRSGSGCARPSRRRRRPCPELGVYLFNNVVVFLSSTDRARRAAGWRAYASGSMPGVLGGVYTRGPACERLVDLGEALIPEHLAFWLEQSCKHIIKLSWESASIFNAVDLLPKQSIARRDSWRVVPTKQWPLLCQT